MNRTICIQTILTLVIVATGVAVGYTNFVQAELKEDINKIELNQKIDTEKITSIQITLAEIKKDVSSILGGK